MLSSVIVVRPLAGSEPEIIVPQNEIWDIISARSFFISDPTVINREVRFIVDNPTPNQGTYIFIPTGVLQAAGESRTYSFVKNLGYRGQGNINVGVNVGIGSIKVPGGFRIRLSTTNIQTGDQWQEMYFIVEKE